MSYSPGPAPIPETASRKGCIEVALLDLQGLGRARERRLVLISLRVLQGRKLPEERPESPGRFGLPSFAHHVRIVAVGRPEEIRALLRKSLTNVARSRIAPITRSR